MADKPNNRKGAKSGPSTGQGNIGDYEVGYKKPPAHTRFKKNVSGNPHGRRRGTKNIATLLDREFNQRVAVRENGAQRMITKREAAIKQFVNGLISGNPRYAKFLMAFLENLAGASDSVAKVAAGVAADDVIDPEAAQKFQELWDQIGAGKKSADDQRGGDDSEDR